MKYSPHDYQRYATEFIIAHPISALLLDMGLGKTSITLTAINDLLFDSFEVHKVLVWLLRCEWLEILGALKSKSGSI